MQRDVIIACDFKSAEDTFRFLDLFKDEERKPFLKIGMELFYAEGPSIVREIKRRGHKIFLDLKLHDIPNTVKKAMAVLSRLDVDMCNVHAAGTIEMMKAALEGLTRADGTRPLLIAVTQLTSTSEERMRSELLIDAGGRHGARGVRHRVPHDHARRAICRRGRSGPGARYDPCPCPGDRLRFHRRGTPDHGCGGPRGGLPPVRGRVRRITDKTYRNEENMKPVKLFYLRTCPFCKKALRYIEEAKAAHPELAAVEIEMIEESERPDVADAFDYYYVPTFYVDGVKVHEGGIYPEEVEKILRRALE